MIGRPYATRLAYGRVPISRSTAGWNLFCIYVLFLLLVRGLPFSSNFCPTHPLLCQTKPSLMSRFTPSQKRTTTTVWMKNPNKFYRTTTGIFNILDATLSTVLTSCIVANTWQLLYNVLVDVSYSRHTATHQYAWITGFRLVYLSCISI